MQPLPHLLMFTGRYQLHHSRAMSPLNLHAALTGHKERPHKSKRRSTRGLRGPPRSSAVPPNLAFLDSSRDSRSFHTTTGTASSHNHRALLQLRPAHLTRLHMCCSCVVLTFPTADSHTVAAVAQMPQSFIHAPVHSLAHTRLVVSLLYPTSLSMICAFYLSCAVQRTRVTVSGHRWN